MAGRSPSLDRAAPQLDYGLTSGFATVCFFPYCVSSRGAMTASVELLADPVTQCS